LKITKVCGEKSKWETHKFYSLTSSCLTTLSNRQVWICNLKDSRPGATKCCEALIIQNYKQRSSNIY